jgi:hypothetical protein
LAPAYFLDCAGVREFATFPEAARATCFSALTITAEGGNAGIATPLDPGRSAFALTLAPGRRLPRVFRDLGHTNADAEQWKATLAAEIIKALDRRAQPHRRRRGRFRAHP